MRSEPNKGKWDVPGWVGTPHGRFVLVNGSWENEFHLRDHLGNTRVVLMEEDTGTLATLQQNHYYPFGMLIPSLGSTNTIGALKDNRYLYNGKEYQDDFELNWHDYGARFYDPQIGRWHSVDPLAEHPRQIDKSPYAAFWNNPIRYADPDGRCPECEENSENPEEGQEYTSEGGATYRYQKNEKGELVWVRVDMPDLPAATITPSSSDQRDQLIQEISILIGIPVSILEPMALANVQDLAKIYGNMLGNNLPLENVGRRLTSAGRTYGALYVAGKVIFFIDIAGSIYTLIQDYSFPKAMETFGDIGANAAIMYGGTPGIFAGALWYVGKAEVKDRQNKMKKYRNPDYGGRYNPQTGQIEIFPWSFRRLQ